MIEGRRKWTLTLIVFGVTATLCFLTKIDQSVYLTVTGWVFTGFVIGNGAEHLIKARNGVK